MLPTTDKAVDVRPLTVVILSGGSGRTAESVLAAALAQFDGADVKLVRQAHVRTAPEALKVVREAAAQGAILCHSLVEPEVRDAVVREAERQMLSAVDVLGPALAVLEDRLGMPPQRVPGLSYELKKEYFDRVDAVDFTLAHDDGARLHDINEADVVLVGVSRVAKSVTCFYLGYRGIRAANVPLIPGLPPPVELLDLAAQKVIGLTINTHRLQAIRSTRVQHMGVGHVDNYVDAREVATELRAARQTMAEHDWRCIDVSYKAVEEVATEVIHMIGW